MHFIQNLAAILAVLAALNGGAMILFGPETPVGAFYERLWHHTILGKNARPGAYDPFVQGPAYVIFSVDDISDLERDYQVARETLGGRVFTAAKIKSYNRHVPQGVLAFAPTESDADYRAGRLSSAIFDAKPPRTTPAEPGQSVIIASGGTFFGEMPSLEVFCSNYQTFEPSRLCFMRD